ncbi:MAG: histidine kinase [Bryobacteraceae bacterium]
MPAKPEPDESSAPSPTAAALLLRLLRRERSRVSAALHDEAGQLLTAAGLELELARADALDRGAESMAAQIGAASTRMEDAFTRIRSLSYETHPDPVSKFGFSLALEQAVDRAKRRFGGRLTARLDRSATPQNNLVGPIYEIVTAAMDIALEEIYSSQVSFSTLNRNDSFRARIRWTTKGGTAIIDEKVQLGVSDAIQEIARSRGVESSVRWDRRCARIVELYG